MNIINVVCGYAGSAELTYSTFSLHFKHFFFFFSFWEILTRKIRETYNQIGMALSPARASKQGNVIGSVRIYIYMCVQKKFVIERTRDLNYLKFVATGFFPKTISPSAGENSGDLA